MTVQVSVVMATYNRARLLPGVLGALAAQEVPDSLQWEIVVVDNNSSDSTPEEVSAFARTADVPVRCVFEPRQGLSHARNRGIEESRGEVVAFLDDDVVPPPDWIVRIAGAFDRWKADGVGGRILPRWESPPPPWLAGNPRLLRLLAIMDFDGSRMLSLPLEREPQVWGANMAFRREVFARVGPFDPRQGRAGERLFKGEESDLIHRALQLGLKVAYDASVTVFHRIGPDRMKKAYFRRLSFDRGQGHARAAPIAHERRFFGAPPASYRAVFAGFWKFLGLRLRGRPESFDQELRWLRSVGELTGFWKVRFEPSR
jgi:glycosyltransferase involved in cell wall biosynthesis